MRDFVKLKIRLPYLACNEVILTVNMLIFSKINAFFLGFFMVNYYIAVSLIQ